MHYVIMNRGALEGFQTKTFKRMTNLFFVCRSAGQTHNSISWSESVADAQMFDSEEEAWYLARLIWGFSFATENLWVVSMQPSSLIKSQANRNKISTLKDGNHG